MTPPGIEPATFRFVAEHLNYCDTAFPNRNEDQEYFLGVKSGRYVRLITLPPSWAIVTYSRNLNFLKPSGHVGPVTGLMYLSLPTINILSLSDIRTKTILKFIIHSLVFSLEDQ